MNTHVIILFVNAMIATLLSSAVVIYILRKEYLPIIKEMEEKEIEREKQK